jgi:hypothetical protein
VDTAGDSDSDQKQEIISIDSGNSYDSDGLLKRNEDNEDDSDDSDDYRMLDDINTPRTTTTGILALSTLITTHDR